MYNIATFSEFLFGILFYTHACNKVPYKVSYIIRSIVTFIYIFKLFDREYIFSWTITRNNRKLFENFKELAYINNWWKLKVPISMIINFWITTKCENLYFDNWIKIYSHFYLFFCFFLIIFKSIWNFYFWLNQYFIQFHIRNHPQSLRLKYFYWF